MRINFNSLKFIAFPENAIDVLPWDFYAIRYDKNAPINSRLSVRELNHRVYSLLRHGYSPPCADTSTSVI